MADNEPGVSAPAEDLTPTGDEPERPALVIVRVEFTVYGNELDEVEQWVNQVRRFGRRLERKLPGVAVSDSTKDITYHR